LQKLKDTLGYVGGLGDGPRGHLKIATGVGFGICVLAEHLPTFLQRYPDVDITLALASKPAELLADGIDVAIRLGAQPDSSMVSVRLGAAA
jgi:DNA-binding transcriptional LysR family regulator